MRTPCGWAGCPKGGRELRRFGRLLFKLAGDVQGGTWLRRDRRAARVQAPAQSEPRLGGRHLACHPFPCPEIDLPIAITHGSHGQGRGHHHVLKLRCCCKFGCGQMAQSLWDPASPTLGGLRIHASRDAYAAELKERQDNLMAHFMFQRLKVRVCEREGGRQCWGLLFFFVFLLSLDFSNN